MTITRLSESNRQLLFAVTENSDLLLMDTFPPATSCTISNVIKDARRILGSIQSGEARQNICGIALEAFCRNYLLFGGDSSIRDFVVAATYSYVVTIQNLAESDRIVLVKELRKFICRCVELQNHVSVLTTWE